MSEQPRHVRVLRPPGMQCTYTNREGARCPNEALQTGDVIVCADHAEWWKAHEAEAVTDTTFDPDAPV